MHQSSCLRSRPGHLKKTNERRKVDSFADPVTTVDELKQLMNEFVQEREWSQFHSPKNLSMSLAIESAEVMEHFQWLTIDESRSLDDSQKQEVAEEVADVC